MKDTKPTLSKEDIIKSIKLRILEEQKKHTKLDWAEIAARKIVSTLKEEGVLLISE